MIKLINADCMDIMKTYPDNYFDLAIVDPPYGINQDLIQLQLANKKGFTKRAGTYNEYHNTNWDNEIPKESYFTELKRVSKNQIIWGGNYYFNLKLSGVIIWYKGNSGKFKEGEMAKTNFNTFKIYHYSRANAYINHCDNKIHPTQKPIQLYKWLLRNYAEKGQKILDTHLGSGSSAIASHYFGCEFVGIEIDKEYFDAAEKRIKDQTRQLTMF